MQFGSTFYASLMAIIILATSAEADPETSGSLLGDAGIIIASEKNDVRLWVHPPRLLVFGDQGVEQVVRDIVETIETAVDSPFGAEFFGEVRFEELPQGLGEGQRPLSMRIREGGPSGWNIHLNLGDDLVFQTDIVLVVADRPSVAMINGLWGMSASDNRAMLEGGISRCFYSARSRNGVRYGALISVFPKPGSVRAEECLWEEIVHALGPLRDAEGSQFFSFDDESVSLMDLTAFEQRNLDQRKRANDLLLLRALYESGVKPGDPPDVVLQYLENLIQVE